MNNYTFKREFLDDGTLDTIEMYKNGDYCKKLTVKFNGYVIAHFSTGYFINGIIHIYKKRYFDMNKKTLATWYY